MWRMILKNIPYVSLTVASDCRVRKKRYPKGAFWPFLCVEFVTSVAVVELELDDKPLFIVGFLQIAEDL